MLRYISIFVLSCTCSLATAQQLYKWVEPDGSITFSPKQPPAGITYETINTSKTEDAGIAASEPPSTPSTPASKPASTPANIEPPQKALPDPSSSASIRNTSTDVDRDDANDSGSAIKPESIVNSSSNVNTEQTGSRRIAASVTGSKAEPTAGIQQIKPTRKQRQCQDLQKRVVSLERRLRSRLTPEDMDNTVVHMARYQRSFDQHCVQ